MASGESVAPPAPPSPKAPGNTKKMIALVIVAVVVVASLGAVTFVLLSGPSAALDSVAVSAARTTIDEREEIVLTATAADTRGGNPTATTAFTWTATPANLVELVPETPASGARITALRSGSVTVTATGSWQGATKSGTLSLTIVDVHFEAVASDSAPRVGDPITVTVNAVRADGSPSTRYPGEVNFTSDDPDATLPANTSFAAQDEGTKVFPGIVIQRMGPIVITMTDTKADITGTLSLTGRSRFAPLAVFTANRTLMHVDGDAQASTDPDNDIATYAWNWGDGTPVTTVAIPTASHDYTTPNVYTITLTITDLGSNQATATRQVSVGPSTLDAEIFDFFAMPFREIWDWRTALYGDVPIGADCFSIDSIPGGAGSPNPSGTGVCDTPPLGQYNGETWATYPYMDWYPWYGDLQSTILYAPYRLRMVGMDQPGSTLAEPVILPVLNASQPAGATLRADWEEDYISVARARQLDTDCGTSLEFAYDGFILEANITIIMDTQESRRIFDVTGDPTAWWAANSNPNCVVKGPAESAWEDWIVGEGGKSALTTGIGGYDVANAFEWWYSPYLTNFVVTVDPIADRTTVKIQHLSWGTEILLARWFYWGTTKYFDAGPDETPGTADDIPNAEIYPHNPTGWWPWEFGWFEDTRFNTTIGGTSQDFTFETVVEYHFQAYANSGPDGIYNTTATPSTDDTAEWLWQPVLADYIYGGTAQSLQKHTVSELDAYAGPDGKGLTMDDMTYYHGTPGSFYYGTDYRYEYVPREWDLDPGDTVTVRLPTGVVKFIDPYSDHTSDVADLITFDGRIEFSQSKPALPSTHSTVADSNGDGLRDLIVMMGPIDWGAPNVPLSSSPVLEFRPRAVISTALSGSAVDRGQAEAGSPPVLSGLAGIRSDPWQALPTTSNSFRTEAAAVRLRT